MAKKSTENRTTLAGRMTVGAVVGAVLAVAWTAKPAIADPTSDSGWLIGAGLVVGALVPYLVSCWRFPHDRCPFPDWWILGPLRGCGDKLRETDGEGRYRMRGSCRYHPDGPWRRFGAILLGRGKPKP